MAQSSGAEAVFAATVALFLGVVTLKLLAFTRVPYSVLLLLWGLVVGVGQQFFVSDWQHLGPGLAVWQDINSGFPVYTPRASSPLPRFSISAQTSFEIQ